MRIYQDGEDIIFYDPTYDKINLFHALYPSYQIESVFHKDSFIPKFQRLRRKSIELKNALFDLEIESLGELMHCSGEDNNNNGHTFLFFDALHTLSLNSISECRLCGHSCGVNRYQKTGKCNIKNISFNSKPEILIAEEPQINPGISIKFSGCGLRCIYCTEAILWEPYSQPKTDPNSIWNEIKFLIGKTKINSIEFVNATESIHSVFEILSAAPKDFSLPVVLNCHLYGSSIFYEIANWIADVWLFDLRYGKSTCAERLSGVKNYLAHAKNGLDAAVNKEAKIIVRVLVLPGHVECCHKPAIELLSTYRDKVYISILNQYVPENNASLDVNLKRRPTIDEISQVEEYAQQYGLVNISSGCADFWKD